MKNTILNELNKKKEKDLLNYLKDFYLDILDLTLDYVYCFMRDFKKIDIRSINVDDFKKANIYLKDLTFDLLPYINDIVPCLDIIYQKKLDCEDVINDYLLERKLRS